MKRTLILALLTVLVGCASGPRPVVPSLEGKPRVQINAAQQAQVNASQPVVSAENSPVTAPADRTFDFVFQGDIQDALVELNRLHPEMSVFPALGEPFAYRVSVNLQNTTMEEVLRSLGEQGADKVDIILDKPQAAGGHKVLLRFN
jgi:hypothetical protein